jgi:hypothetical protein
MSILMRLWRWGVLKSKGLLVFDDYRWLELIDELVRPSTELTRLCQAMPVIIGILSRDGR